MQKYIFKHEGVFSHCSALGLRKDRSLVIFLFFNLNGFTIYYTNFLYANIT